MPYQTLYVSEVDKVVTITLNRPDRRNALNPQLIEELITIIDCLARRTSGVVILTGRGAAFCAGLDLEHLQSLASKTAAEHRADSHAWSATQAPWSRSPPPQGGPPHTPRSAPPHSPPAWRGWRGRPPPQGAVVRSSPCPRQAAAGPARVGAGGSWGVAGGAGGSAS